MGNQSESREANRNLCVNQCRHVSHGLGFTCAAAPVETEREQRRSTREYACVVHAAWRGVCSVPASPSPRPPARCGVLCMYMRIVMPYTARYHRLMSLNSLVLCILIETRFSLASGARSAQTADRGLTSVMCHELSVATVRSLGCAPRSRVGGGGALANGQRKLLDSLLGSALARRLYLWLYCVVLYMSTVTESISKSQIAQRCASVMWGHDT